MELQQEAIEYVIKETGIKAASVLATATLLFKEDGTIPFIARYRKERTGNLDEVQIRDIQEKYEAYLEMEKRRTYIIEQITKLKMLTPALEKKINMASTLKELEDLYAPYKSKKKTKAQTAKELGLQPLADFILSSKADLTDEQKATFQAKAEDFEKAMAGAKDIIIETMAHDVDCKNDIRTRFWSEAKIVSSKRKKAEEVKGFEKFKDFFEFEEKISQIKMQKNTHRFMALRRGLSLKVLKVEVVLDNEVLLTIIENKYYPSSAGLANKDILEQCATKAAALYISPSMDLEVKSELKTVADDEAIKVFSQNLKNLLLQPYLGSKTVLGIDPGIRTGCKCAIVDNTGKFIVDFVIYPFGSDGQYQQSVKYINQAIEHFKVEYMAIGNGTNGRETLHFVQKECPAIQKKGVKATMINEAGASIYSASDIARKEFPDKDVTVRGAISIARRFQDPLAELVKIDPKSIGVGQYQHDVNQTKLKKSLEGVVESCVNYVGVDVNTASAPLLSYISGIGPTVAKNIVTFREKNKGFKNRSQLLEVSRFSPKVFEQSAGFLRIYDGENPLDGTFVHPESYSVIEKWCKDNKLKLQDLRDSEVVNQFSSDKTLREQLGDLTFNDIVTSLKAPAQDPRSEFKSTEFDPSLKGLGDLQTDKFYTGIVSNITNFGAFVDIGIKENGLLHVSQMADHFVENALNELSVGQEIKVRVIEVDQERGRISLSAKKLDGAHMPMSSGGTKSKKKDKRKNVPIKNNAFSGLAGLKLK